MSIGLSVLKMREKERGRKAMQKKSQEAVRVYDGSEIAAFLLFSAIIILVDFLGDQRLLMCNSAPGYGKRPHSHGWDLTCGMQA